MRTINNRIKSMYRSWYQPDIYMTSEEWIYIAYLLATWNFSVGVGLLIGFIIC